VIDVPGDALAELGGRLCIWLREPLQRLEDAATRGRLGHAWLITGRPGLGKLNLALVFADRLLRGRVGAAPPPDLPAAAALEAMRNRAQALDHHPDLHCVFPAEDKRSISIEQVRAVTDALALKSFHGGSKVVVVEPAEALTVPAANALLKALEEPSPGTYMLLVSHQPGRLASTIRSRCQTLVVRAPPSAPAERGRAARPELAPLWAAAAESEEYISKINELEASLNLVYESKRDPIEVADQWGDEDLDATLDWLGRRIHAVVRARVLADASKPVTVGTNPVLHNAWPGLRLAALFQQFAAVERLRLQLDGGVNAELALRALLMGFVAERG
jgi:DNA polymerase-3 subunit delta'